MSTTHSLPFSRSALHNALCAVWPQTQLCVDNGMTLPQVVTNAIIYAWTNTIAESTHTRMIRDAYQQLEKHGAFNFRDEEHGVRRQNVTSRDSPSAKRSPRRP